MKQNTAQKVDLPELAAGRRPERGSRLRRAIWARLGCFVRLFGIQKNVSAVEECRRRRD